MPKSISAMPTAISFTLGRLQISAWINPMNTPTMPAANTPSQGEPV